MDGRIGRLNLRCKILGASQNAGALQARLERVARQQLAAEYEAAIGSALGDDPSVYVLRKVNARLAMALDPLAPDRAAARTWGQRAALEAVRTIARQPQGDGLVRFDDQADFVAHFITDLVHGKAWERWFYGAFGDLRQLPARDALLQVLEDNLTQLSAILARLHGSGEIDPLLSALGPEGRRWLWSQARGDETLEAAGARSILNVALDLFDRLDLWQGGRPALKDLPADLLSGSLAPLDWRDPQSLADGLLALAQALLRRGDIRRDPNSLDLRLPEALAPLEWLDAGRLEHGLRALFQAVLFQPPSPALFDLPLRSVSMTAGQVAPVPRLTPRQKLLLETLRDLVASGQVSIEPGEGDVPAVALRLYGALLARDVGWAGDGLALETIGRLVDGWRWLRQSGAPEVHLRRIARGEVVPGAEAANLALLGEPGAQVLGAMLHQTRSARAGTVLQTGCAGAALLLRVLLDARLTLLYRDVGFAAQQPGLDGLLLALLLAWAGPAGRQAEAIDPGLLLLAGLVARPDGQQPIQSAADLRERWQDVGAATGWQALWLRVLHSQHLLQPQAMLLYRLRHAGQDLLAAGDASGSLWPLVATEGIGGVMMRWPEAWQQVSGVMSPVISRTSAAAVDIGEELAAIYHNGAERLPVVLEALAGRTSLAPAWDYSLALTANSILRLWARWLRGFNDASVPFLLESFLHRPGTITHTSDRLVVALQPRPLDIVLQMSGYLDALQIPWMGGLNLTFEIQGG
jgi:hypothetical protein